MRARLCTRAADRAVLGGRSTWTLAVAHIGATVELVTLYRPVGPKELELIAASGFHEFPPRLAHQPIFYPVLNEDYAVQIARDWNVRESGAGFVTRFSVSSEFLRRYPVQTVGASLHKELWVPADELPEFNRNIVGLIEVIAKFGVTDSGQATANLRWSGP